MRFLLSLLPKASLLAALLLGSASATQAQYTSWNGTKIRTSSVRQDDEDYVRNHGTGVKLGAARAGFGTSFEVGGFHQHALGKVGSVQAELLYYRQRTATGTTGGLRLPALLVLNPLDNISLHFGPQLQWQPATATPVAGTDAAEAPKPTPHFSTAFVTGAEARVEFVRIGMRFAVPFDKFAEPVSVARHIADDWKTKQVQFYVGVGF